MRSHKLSYGAVSLLLSCLPADAKQYEAKHYDVSLSLAASAVLNVTETVEFQFGSGPFTYVYRNLAATETDGIDGVEASLDGVVCALGGGPGQVEVRGSSPVRVVWHFSPVENLRHTFTLRYRVLGAIRKLGEADALVWRALPPDREYRIGKSRITLEYPEGVRLLRPPSMRKVDAPFTVGPGRAAIELTDVRSGFPAIVTAEFPPGSMASSAPAWQVSAEERRRDFMTGLRVGAIGSLWIAIAAVLMVLWARRRQPERVDISNLYTPHPPGDLNPSLAAVLVGSHGGMGAMLLELASRGVLQIEQTERSRWRSPDFRIELRGETAGLSPHERKFVELIFKGGGRSAKLSECGTRLTGGWPGISRALEGELRAHGLIDEERSRTKKRLLALSGLGLFLGFALFVAGLILHKQPEAERLAGILIALGVGALVIAFIVLVLAARLSRLTDRGAELAAQWRSFARHLKEISRGNRETSGTSEFERFLPYAAAFGLAGAWTKRFQTAGGNLPSWFTSLGGDDGSSGFLAFVAGSDPGGMAGGADGGAGASGGGGSGAG